MINFDSFYDFKSCLCQLDDDDGFDESFRDLDNYMLSKNDFSLYSFCEFRSVVYKLIFNFFESIYKPDSIPSDNINLLTDSVIKSRSYYFDSLIKFHFHDLGYEK